MRMMRHPHHYDAFQRVPLSVALQHGGKFTGKERDSESGLD